MPNKPAGLAPPKPQSGSAQKITPF